MKLLSPMGRILALSWLCLPVLNGVAHAQNEYLPTYQPQLSAILRRATETIPQGEKGEGARQYLCSAQTLNGDFAAAKVQIEALTSPARRSRAWGKLGYAQSQYKDDAEGAKVSFEAAKREAKRIDSGLYDQERQLADVALFQARSEDVEGALDTVNGVSSWAKFSALSDVARAAARDGDFTPAQQLVQLAKDEEDKSLANGLLCIAHAEAYNWDAALAALQKTTVPKHRVAALITLFHDQKLKDGERDLFLPQALELVPQIRSDDEIDLSDIVRDADYGAIALAQFQNHDHADVHAAAARCLEILKMVQDGSNAQDSLLKIAAILADEDLPKARELITMRGNDVATIGAVVKVLGENWSWRDRTEEEKATLSAQMSELINMSMDVVRAREGSDKHWTLATVATMTAQAHDFDTAKTLADQIDTPRRKAYGFAGIARAAIEQNNAERVSWSLGLMEAAAQEETDANERGEIIAQSVQSILEPLLEDEPVSLSAAAAGLN